MKVLVLESDAHGSDDAVRALEAAGHEVRRCHEPGADAFPCAALAGRPCPVVDEGIDVAVTVRTRAGERPTLLEDGVACALRAHVPVVVAGEGGAPTPLSDWATEIVGEADVVDACARAAAAPLRRHSAVATTELAAALRSGGFDPAQGRAEVHRRRGRLRVTLDPNVVVDRVTAEVAVRRVMAALRELDPTAAGLDISLPGSDESLG
jgi:hypothetical protein